MKSLRAFVLAYPVLLPAAFLATWTAGRFSLGYWPRPSLDDPKSIGPLVDFFYRGTELLLILGLPLFLVSILALLGRALTQRPERRPLTLTVLASAVCFGAAILFLRWDPLEVMRWYAD
jgi:hypothetical protein